MFSRGERRRSIPKGADREIALKSSQSLQLHFNENQGFILFLFINLFFFSKINLRKCQIKSNIKPHIQLYESHTHIAYHTLKSIISFLYRVLISFYLCTIIASCLLIHKTKFKRWFLLMNLLCFSSLCSLIVKSMEISVLPKL